MSNDFVADIAEGPTDYNVGTDNTFEWLIRGEDLKRDAPNWGLFQAFARIGDFHVFPANYNHVIQFYASTSDGVLFDLAWHQYNSAPSGFALGVNLDGIRHIAFRSIFGGAGEIYLNGALVGTGPNVLTGGPGGAWIAGTTEIGGASFINDSTATIPCGRIAHWAYYDGGLTPAQILDHAAAVFSGDGGAAYQAKVLGDNPRRYYPMQETTGIVMEDFGSDGIDMAYQVGVPLGLIGCVITIP